MSTRKMAATNTLHPIHSSYIILLFKTLIAHALSLYFPNPKPVISFISDHGIVAIHPQYTWVHTQSSKSKLILA
jgi:hypothetical protein